MILKVQNLGVLLEEVQIDLSKRLLLFCGPNNAGKTQLSYTIYGLNTILRKWEAKTGEHLSSDYISNVIDREQSLINIMELLNERIDFIYELIKDYNSKLKLKVFGGYSEICENTKLSVILKSHQTDKYINAINNLDFTKEFNIEDEAKTYRIQIIKEKGSINSEIKFYSIQHGQAIDKSLFFLKGENPKLKNFIVSILTKAFTSDIIKILFSNTYISPTERTSINIFFKELLTNRFQTTIKMTEEEKKENLKKITDELLKTYTLPITDRLIIASKYRALQEDHTTEEIQILSNYLKQNVLHGHVWVDEGGEMNFKPYPISKELSSPESLKMHVSGSSIKALASFVFYLDHHANFDDLYIIDEPELNLHPENQINMARFLAKLVNHGFKVIVSTHSDYIIRELNMLIKLSNPKLLKIRKKLKYSDDEILIPDIIGVYAFKKRDDGNITVEKQDVTNSGFEIEDIDKVIQIQNSSLFKINNSLRDQEDFQANQDMLKE